MARWGQPIRERLVGVVAMVVLGFGLLDLFLGVLPGVPFWAVFVIGFAVVVPLTAILLGVENDEPRSIERGEEHLTETDRTDQALADLRERYARGELTDEQFERKLDRLLDTETVETAEETRREIEEV